MEFKTKTAKIFIITALLTILPGIGSAGDVQPLPGITYTPLKQVVPGPGLPDGLDIRGSNNNLDIVKYKDRIFFAFRTAPTHFASRATRLIIVSSADGGKWDLEYTIHMGRDMREPRFLVYKDKLFFYYFSSGKNFWTFSPQHMWASEYQGPGKWTEPRKIWKPGYVVWRPKVHNGMALMSSYIGSGVLETKDGKPSEVTLLKSEDGINWEPFDPDQPVQVFYGGEAAFEFDAEGNLYTVVRNEAGATKICKAPASNIADWQCEESTWKYDSPIMFKHKSGIYLIARRNIAGEFHRDSKIVPNRIEPIMNLGRYWVTRKRTAMYKFDTEKMEIVWLFDFPSRGDTSFPALIQLDENRYLLYNYSSPIDGFDWVWVGGQLTGTRIYSTVITFHNSE